MERPLWAPWRMAFIDAPKPAGCIFCNFPKEEGQEAERRNLLVHRSAHSFTLLNKYPYNSGHLLVIPRSHVSSFDSLSSEEFFDLHGELKRAVAVIREVYRPEGFNIGMNLGQTAGAGIADHLHYHVVPRWNGDTNFMPILAETKVIIEHLDAAWERIRKGFGN